MGMRDDLKAASVEVAIIVRGGSAIFGRRWTATGDGSG
jgi:uncharacterized pyridoxal phosphate-containing UPF0001 family protein